MFHDSYGFDLVSLGPFSLTKLVSESVGFIAIEHDGLGGCPLLVGDVQRSSGTTRNIPLGGGVRPLALLTLVDLIYDLQHQEEQSR